MQILGDCAVCLVRTVKVEERQIFLFECYRAVSVQMRMQMMVSVEDTAMVWRPV